MKNHILSVISIAGAGLAVVACSSLPELPADIRAGVEANTPEAFYTAGKYYDGLQNAGKRKKWTKSAEYYRRGADLGNADCQREIGYAYQTGAGVPQDYAQARAWYTKAAEQQQAEALNDLGYLSEEGLGGPVNYALAKDYYERSAALNNAAAINNLGALYANGLGVKKDRAKALTFLDKAAAMGDKTAKENAAALRSESTAPAPAAPACISGMELAMTDARGQSELLVGGFNTNNERFRSNHEGKYTKTGPSTATYRHSWISRHGDGQGKYVYKLTFTSRNSGTYRRTVVSDPYGPASGPSTGTFRLTQESSY